MFAGCYALAPDAPAELDAGPEDSGVIEPKAEFEQHVAPILGGADGKSGACGACHAEPGGLGPAFMAPNPDMLTTVLRYPALIGERPETSRLYTKGLHSGPALTDPQKVI